MKLVARVLAVLITGLPVSAWAQGPDQPGLGVSGVRLALFSPQRAFAESADGKNGLATLTALQEKRTREIEERRKTLEERERMLQETLSLLSDDARNERVKELDRFRLDTERFVEDAQAEYLGIQRGIENAFLAKLGPALEQVAQSMKLDVIVNADSAALAWWDRRLDVTTQVVEQLARAESR
jgi:Skp family chaperone for outer membrane proteins